MIIEDIIEITFIQLSGEVITIGISSKYLWLAKLQQ